MPLDGPLSSFLCRLFVLLLFCLFFLHFQFVQTIAVDDHRSEATTMTRFFFSDELAKLKAPTNTTKSKPKPNKNQPPVGKLTRSQSLAISYASMFLRQRRLRRLEPFASLHHTHTSAHILRSHHYKLAGAFPNVSDLLYCAAISRSDWLTKKIGTHSYRNI